MTNKEVLAELKKSYIYVEDLIDNAKISEEDKNSLRLARGIIEENYYNFYKELDKEEVRIVYKNEFTGFIGEDVFYDYISYNENGEEEYYTCEDIDYFWYEDKDFLEE